MLAAYTLVRVDQHYSILISLGYRCGFSLPMDWSNDCNHANGLCKWEHYPTSGVASACPWIGAMTVTMPMDCANGSIIQHQDAEKVLLLAVRTEDAEKVLLLVVRTEDAEKTLLLAVRTEDAEKVHVLLPVFRTQLLNLLQALGMGQSYSGKVSSCNSNRIVLFLKSITILLCSSLQSKEHVRQLHTAERHGWSRHEMFLNFYEKTEGFGKDLSRGV
ncbi:hypothetical protein EMCRGX_G005309 [Ephydatia muelleri]